MFGTLGAVTANDLSNKSGSAWCSWAIINLPWNTTHLGVSKLQIWPSHAFRIPKRRKFLHFYNFDWSFKILNDKILTTLRQFFQNFPIEERYHWDKRKYGKVFHFLPELDRQKELSRKVLLFTQIHKKLTYLSQPLDGKQVRVNEWTVYIKERNADLVHSFRIVSEQSKTEFEGWVYFIGMEPDLDNFNYLIQRVIHLPCWLRRV